MIRLADIAPGSARLTYAESVALVGRCLQVYVETRATHPDLLGGRLTWNGARGLCRRLGVRLIITPLVREAQVIAPLGTPVILLNSEVPPRRHTYRVAHELGHVLMGHAESGDELVYHLSPCEPDDPREDEAELLATLLCQGPGFAALWERYRDADV